MKEEIIIYNEEEQIRALETNEVLKPLKRDKL